MRKATDSDIIAILALRPSSCKELAALLDMNAHWLSERLRVLVLSGAVTRHRLLQGDGRTPVYGVGRGVY